MCLVEGDASFIEQLVTSDLDLVRIFLIIAIFEALKKSERAEDPEDVLCLSVDERCDVERLITVLGEVRDAGVIDLAKELRKAQKHGEQLGLSTEETAFYDALAENGSAKDINSFSSRRNARRKVNLCSSAGR